MSEYIVKINRHYAHYKLKITILNYVSTYFIKLIVFYNILLQNVYD